MKAVNLDNIWEKYRIKFVKENGVSWREVWALREVNFAVEQGEVLGIIGQNGAGKTTLLKIIAGMLMPDRGKVNVRGKVSTLMELGAGFNREFTGRENIILNARIYGLSKKDINIKMQEVIEFAGLGEFIDAPIKYYSQGMYLRLAFSLAISLDPDILLIDDIIAVGDEASSCRCIDKIRQLKKEGKTIILVTHQMDMVAQMCDRVIHLNKGKIIDAGSPGKIIPAYLETVGRKEGIKVFEKYDFRVVFNNGRLSLSYAGNPLTGKMGVSAVWFNPRINGWVSSKDLNWQNIAKDNASFIFEGSHQGFDSLQVWTISLEKDILEWTVKFEGKEIQNPHFDLGFRALYDHWVVEKKEEEFLPFLSKLNWQDLGTHDCFFGGVGMFSSQKSGSLPAFIFGQKKQAQKIKLFNTGYHNETRVAQSLLDSNCAEFYIRLFSQKRNLLKYMEKKKKELPASYRFCRLEYKHLRIEASGREKTIKIYYRGREVTAGCGMSVSFQRKEEWYSAVSARWKLVQKEDCIQGELFWPDFRLRQVWEISIKEGGVCWKADIDTAKINEIDDFKMGILVREEYKRYVSGHQEGVFPKDFTNWMDIDLEDKKAEHLGTNASGDLPGIILTNKGRWMNVVENSDKKNRCRALQFRLPFRNFKEKGFSTEINIFKDNLFAGKCVEEKKPFWPSNLVSVSAAAVKVGIDLDAKKIRLFYQGREISERACLRNHLLISEKGFESRFMGWQVEQISKDKAVLTMSIKNFPVVERWEFFCGEDNSLKIRIDLEVGKKVRIIDNGLSLELKDGYQSWFTAGEKGDFIAKKYENDTGAIRMKDSNVSAICLKSGESKNFPDLTFAFNPSCQDRIINLYKKRPGNDYGSSIGIYTAKLSTRKKSFFKPGSYNLLEGKMFFGKQPGLSSFQKKTNKVKLARPGLELNFYQGKGRLYWKGKEITAGLGIYSCFCHFGIWHDSSLAAWEVIEQNRDNLSLAGDWAHLPVSQVWKIKLREDKRIIWEVETEVHQELELEAIQNNLMVSPLYKEWAAPGFSRGEFSEIFTGSYDILPFRAWSGPADKLLVKSRELPDLSFRRDKTSGGLQGLLENSDYFYRSRLIQYQQIGVEKLKPGKYSNFKGVVEIEPKEN
ncbi:MAG: ABC transporter ATP-binding protein [Candidatus Omnitrophica bacterium]|nr:ABC transporter ATP-binding protein [Candidatus Omnitrophota bacterium]MCF7891437.1 ABC transporter ATP-binding protein [Candidatus Omnitrophota bacterium]MCF7908910.1 ABC transporter ATP-binding protein [Candidatus Omnitrophota bacterium]